MNSLEALFFPGTEIYSASQFPVFLLFQKLHLLQPVESSDNTDNSPDIFITDGLCQAHTPSPLGPDKERFLRLLSDIKMRKDDYAAQLSALTIASFSGKRPSVDDSEQGIVSSLLGKHQLAAQAAEPTDTLLWQARLVLKIGELLDREEEEVAMHMVNLDDQEDEVFKTLQGEMEDEETDSLFSELQQIRQKVLRPTASNVKARLGAWTKLYLSDQLTEPMFWLTAMPETADILLEKYEKNTQAAATILTELELPANIGWARDKAVETAHNFQEKNTTLLAELGSALITQDKTKLDQLVTQWGETLEEDFPKKENGRVSLTMYQFSTSSCGALLGKPAGSGKILAVMQWLE